MTRGNLDSKILALAFGVGIAGVLVGAMITWAFAALEQAQTIEDPTQKAIEEQGLL